MATTKELAFRSNRDLVLTSNRELSRAYWHKIRRLTPLEDQMRSYRAEAEPSLECMRPCDKREFFSEVADSRVLYVDDWHSHPASKRFFERLLFELSKRGKGMVFATELFPVSAQPEIDAYLTRSVGEDVLLAAIDRSMVCGESQRAAYLHLFQVARRVGLPIVAINYRRTGASLQERDGRMARKIQETALAYPHALVCVFVGGWHLGQTHLPARVSELSHGKLQSTILFQNLERVYGALVRRHLEQSVELVRINDGVYCSVTTTPLSQRLADYAFLQECREDDGRLANNVVSAYFRVLSEVIGLDVTLRNTDVYYGDFPAFREAANGKTPPEILGEGKSGRHVITPNGLLFLPKNDVDLLIEALGAYAHLRVARSGYAQGNALFYDEVLQHALSQFVIRLVDHKHAFHLPEISWLQDSQVATVFELRVATETDHYLSREKEILTSERSRFFSLRGALRHEIVRNLGYVLGDRLFDEFIQDNVSSHMISVLFSYSPNDAIGIYTDLRKQFS